MNSWTKTIVVGAALLAGCTGRIGSGTATGTASTGTAGTTGTTVTGGAGTTGTTSTGTAGTTGVAVVDPAVCVPGVPPTSQLTRLTQAQYDNTIRDLLGIDNQPSTMLAPDGLGSVDQRAWDGYQTAAASLAPQVMATATLKAKAIPCTPTGDGSACALQLIQSLGPRAFRRPLTTDETNRFVSLYTNRATLTATGTFDEAAQLIVQSFLVSPSFLTREEISETTDGTNIVLNGYEVASRLSYMLWGSMPDDALFAKAAAGTLATSDGILTEATRMLADSKARAKVADFHAHYALMGDATRWSEAAHDSSLFPAFTAAMVPELADEAKRFFDYVTFDLGGTFQDLITKPVAFVNKDLAPIYGLDPANFTTTPVLTNLDPATRSGVFTHAGFLGSYSSYDRTSPILRGAFIEKQVLCRTIGSPPPGASTTALPATGNTNRDRVTAQTSPDACAGCHGPIVNPPGFALEAYDSIGTLQTTEKSTGAAIDSTADVLIGSKTVHVTGPVDLMAAIAASPEGQGCYAQRWVTYAYERDLTSQDVCTVQSLASKMTQGGYTIRSLITDLTQSQTFRFRAKELP